MGQPLNPVNEFGQYVPAGSYQKSSSDISVTLTAQCISKSGGTVPSTLTFSTSQVPTIGDIENTNGVLTLIPGSGAKPNPTNKFGQYVPAGSYQNSSSAISMKVNAQCKQKSGGLVPSALTFAADRVDTIGDIENTNGVLTLVN